MFATRSELLEKIRLGEDSFLELKEVRFAGVKVRGPEQNDLADELAAFANSHGGVLVLGVQDKTREVLGIPLDRLDEVEALVRQACDDSVKPVLAPLIERLTLPDVGGAEQPVLRDSQKLYAWAAGEEEYGEDSGESEELEDGPILEVRGSLPIYLDRPPLHDNKQ